MDRLAEARDRRHWAVLPHGLRLITFAVATLILRDTPWVVIAAGALFFASFAFAHDLVHGALGLPRQTGDVLLSLMGAVMLTSGHGMRVTHLLHHRRALADDDLEGHAARLTFGNAVLSTPWLWLRMRTEVFARARPRIRRRIVWESLINGASLLALSLLGQWLLAATLCALQVLMPLWAGYLSHRAPTWLLRVARAMAFTRSPTMLSLAYHDVHHRHPSVPCHRLAAVAPRGLSF